MIYKTKLLNNIGNSFKDVAVEKNHPHILFKLTTWLIKIIKLKKKKKQQRQNKKFQTQVLKKSSLELCGAWAQDD